LLNILAFIFVLGIAILFHEFGHFITAKLAGIKVFRFSLGFGPKIAGFFWKGTEYILCLLPFGGYVKMAGETPQDEEDKNAENRQMASGEYLPDKERFDKKPFFIRFAVIFNGPIMNLILAILLLIIVFYFSGTAQVTNIINDVTANSPAEKAGIISGDKIVEIDSTLVENAEEISEIINKGKGRIINIRLMRNNSYYETKVAPEYNSEYDRAMIGITLEVDIKKISLFQSFRKSFEMFFEIIHLIAIGFLETFTGKIPVELAGPLGIAQMAGEAAKIGFLNLLFFSAVINIFLGIINLFPIPILDGGQIVLLAIEKVRGKPLEPEYINLLYIIGFTLIIMIFLIATYQDILRIFSK
jgi:regulator of sigma E protease